MTQDAAIIKSNLQKYPFINKFLGNTINQRLCIECYTHGMLTANLLVHERLTICDLQRLDYVLQLGNLHCRDFNQIFRSKRLPQQSEIADGQIIEILAEVKAFEFLHIQGFSDISTVKRQPNIRTVDFRGKRKGQDYAVEVTRLGLAKSEEKQPKQAYIVDTINYTKCEDAKGFRISMKTEGLNVCRIVREISDAINNKYSQIKDFCQREKGKWKGMLVISSGRDYFAMGKHENKEYEDTPKKDFLAALTTVWKSLQQEGRDKYLHNVVITRGKDLGKAIIFPAL